MKWTVLADNRSANPAFSTEHGLSIFLEVNGLRVLLDTGASDLMIRHAHQLGIDLGTVDYVFISHGHSDHGGGLQYLADLNSKATVIISPDAFSREFYSGRGHFHSITTSWPSIPKGRLILADQTREIVSGLGVIAHIAHHHPMPKGNQLLFVQDDKGDYIHDDFRHEIAFYADGLLFTGCAHSGVENILEACPWPVHTVLGGFHLIDGQESESVLTAFAQRLKTNYPAIQFYTSHCTGNAAFAVLKQVMGDQLHAFACGMAEEVG